MAGEHDLKLVNGDLTFGPDDEPLFLEGTDAVAQDVRHRLLESGMVPELIGDEGTAAAALGRIAAEVEEDERIEPGTARAAPADSGEGYTITADTVDGSAVAQTVGA